MNLHLTCALHTSPRAILSPAKVVMIDEATANVDSQTDSELQQVNCGFLHLVSDQYKTTSSHCTILHL